MRYGIITATSDSPTINPGSVLIAKGIMHLVKKADPDASFFEVCQDKQIDDEWSRVTLDCDCLIFGGGPRINSHPDAKQFCDWNIWGLVQLARAFRVKCMDLFVGATHYLPLAPVGEMARALTAIPKNQDILTVYNGLKLTIARDPVMAEAVRIITQSKPFVLPCASFWAKNWYGIRPKQTKKYNALAIRWLPGNEWLLERLAETAERFEHVVAHDENDLKWIAEHGPKEMYKKAILLDDAKKLLEFYSEAERVMSFRLHGSIAALSMGAKVWNIGIDSGIYALNPFEVTSLMLDDLREPDVYRKITMPNGTLPKDFSKTVRECETKFNQLFKRVIK